MAERRAKPPLIPMVRVRKSTEAAAKELVLDILAVAGGELECKTRLYKAFYAAHLVYHRLTNEFLTGHPIVHMPHGPGIDGGERLLNELVEVGDLAVYVDTSQIFPEQTFRLPHSFELDPTGPRFDAINVAVKWVRSKSAGELSAETHEKSKSWIATKDGEEMNIYLDLLTDEEITGRQNALAAAEELVTTAFAR